MEDIVGAMKAYAGVALRKTDEFVPNIREYEEHLLRALSDLMINYPHISFDGKGGGKRIVLAFGASQGLCGPFNEKLASVVKETVNRDDSLFVIGGRLRSLLDAAGISYEGSLDSAVSVDGIQEALKKTVLTITEIYGKKEYYNLTFIFTVISKNRALILTQQALPPDMEILRGLKPANVSPLTYSEPDAVFGKVLEEFLWISLYRCYTESMRSENWYRLRSMEGASENLKKRIFLLESQQNYIRQEEITEEMHEILGGGMFFEKL